MNGVRNLFFILLLSMFLIVMAYEFSISDTLSTSIYLKINTAGFSNALTTNGYNTYNNLRDFMFQAVTMFLVPFLLLLAFGSSFINNNQSIIGYLIQALTVLMATPLVIYAFSEVMTQLLNVSIINPTYIFTTYFNNFLFILVVNMLLSLASFIFVRQGAVQTQ